MVSRFVPKREVADLLEANRVEGWCPVEQGEMLFEAAKRVANDELIVELGSYMGLSTAWLAFGSSAGYGARVVSVDAHDPEYMKRKGGGSQSLVRNMRQLGLDVDMIAGYTTDVAKSAFRFGIERESIALLYIDADHAYESVSADFFAWFRFLRPDAVIIFDDYTSDHPGVVRFVRTIRDLGVIEHGEIVGHAYKTVLACHT